MAVALPHKSSEYCKQAGFTLVEVLCVLALLGLTAGLVVLNLPKPAPPFRTDVQSLTTLLNLAARQSIIDGKSRGIDITTGQLDILQYDGEWISDRAQAFPDAYDIALFVEGAEIDLNARQKKKEKSDLAPLIYFDATGNVTSFTLSLEGREESFVLAPDARGRIVMEPAP